MLFNSYIFVLLFLPTVFAGYFFCLHTRFTRLAVWWLTIASFVFYACWDPKYLLLIFASILTNFIFGRLLYQAYKYKKALLVFAVAVNVGTLIYFKYTDFLILNTNNLFGTAVSLPHIVLPLGISFFTFTQIAYLVDTYRNISKEYDFVSYCLFVTYFPHLIAGPILHHRDMMPQFRTLNAQGLNGKNISIGLVLFVMGLFKKVVIADGLAPIVHSGFDNAASLEFIGAWITSWSYTFQLYFDFSGYSDMAVGSALLFNIQLPINFNSPYRSTNIREFWKRWHITLSKWLKDYVYIPLGGNRANEMRTSSNLILTFLIGGIWHGAGWTFVIWGALHGLASAIQRGWSRLQIPISRWLAWMLTLIFVNVAWVFFRASSVEEAIIIISKMFGLGASGDVTPLLGRLHLFELILLLSAFIISFLPQNSTMLAMNLKPSRAAAVALAFLSVICLTLLNKRTEFLYFQF